MELPVANGTLWQSNPVALTGILSQSGTFPAMDLVHFPAHHTRFIPKLADYLPKNSRKSCLNILNFRPSSSSLSHLNFEASKKKNRNSNRVPAEAFLPPSSARHRSPTGSAHAPASAAAAGPRRPPGRSAAGARGAAARRRGTGPWSIVKPR